MKQRIFSAALALCLFISSPLAAYAEEDDTPQQDMPLQQEAAFAEGSTYGLDVRDNVIPTPTEVYNAMIALKDRDDYKEGTIWTNDEPYSGSGYHWNGGLLDGKNISAVGCVAFAFILSDEAFGSLPGRMYAAGGFTYEDINVGDILRVNNDAHTVIVLEVSDVGVVVAEGNISTGDHKGKVHWGRAISKEEVMSSTSHYITRYPEGYVSPDDPTANDIVDQGTLAGGLTWTLIKAGTLTISGNGAMPDFSNALEQPWIPKDDDPPIRKVVIGNGVTSIGACAFWNCGVLSAEIPASVTTIGNSAFRESSIISVTIPSSVKTIGDSAFQKCQNLSSVTVSEGVETIGQNAFQSCTGLTSITLPASIGEVGAAAFFQCQKLTSVTFAAGSKQVKLGDNLFTQCYELMNVKLPQSIDRISDGMFQNCLLLSKIEIPQGAQSIGGSAFASSGLTTVIIPDSVTSIGIAAFSPCPLTDIYFTGTETQWNSIRKIGDTAAAVSKATIHYNYVPEQPTPPDEPTPPDDTDPDTPFIENESGTKGWIAIKEKAEAASDGAQVQVNMNGASAVPGYVLDSIKGKNVTISFDMGEGIVWLVNGRDVTADHANNVDLSVQEIPNIPQNIVNNTAGNRQTKQIHLAHSGEFGYSAVLRINVDSANAGLYANLFYYNEGARRLEFVTDDQIDGNGIAELTFTHASDYVIVIDRASMDDGSGGSGGDNGGGSGGSGGSGSGGGSGGSGGSGSGGSGGSGDSGSGGESSGGSNSGGTSSGSNSGSPSADGTGTQGTEKRSPMTGEFDIVFGGSNAAGSEHEGNDLSILWLLAIGTAGMAITVRKRNKISGRSSAGPVRKK